jgi:putative membrane protein
MCGHMEPSDGTREPDYRFTLANERTFLAWIRTALALIAGGVAVVQLVPSFGFPGRRWQRVQDAMRRGTDLPPSKMPMVLAAAILAVVVLVLVVLVAAAQGS